MKVIYAFKSYDSKFGVQEQPVICLIGKLIDLNILFYLV